VFTTVLPALALWFVALSAAYRFRLLDRILGLSELPAGSPSAAATPSSPARAGR
jgi:hypothetical protein